MHHANEQVRLPHLLGVTARYALHACTQTMLLMFEGGVPQRVFRNPRAEIGTVTDWNDCNHVHHDCRR